MSGKEEAKKKETAKEGETIKEKKPTLVPDKPTLFPTTTATKDEDDEQAERDEFQMGPPEMGMVASFKKWVMCFVQLAFDLSVNKPNGLLCCPKMYMWTCVRENTAAKAGFQKKER